MEIKYKLYPYPVLSSYSNDYGTGAFDVAIDIVRDGYDLRIDFLATLTCQSLQDCIKQGKISMNGEMLVCLPHRITVSIVEH